MLCIYGDILSSFSSFSTVFCGLIKQQCVSIHILKCSCQRRGRCRRENYGAIIYCFSYEHCFYYYFFFFFSSATFLEKFPFTLFFYVFTRTCLRFCSYFFWIEISFSPRHCAECLPERNVNYRMEYEENIDQKRESKLCLTKMSLLNWKGNKSI